MIEAVFTLTLAAAVRCQQMAVEPPGMPPVAVENFGETEERKMVKEETWIAPMPEEHLAHLVACCEKEGVPVEIALALIERESGFQADDVSETDDHGYMQINRCHFDVASLINLYPESAPLDNIEYGVGLLADDYRVFGSWGRALMVYADGFYALKRPEWVQGFTERELILLDRADEIRENGGVIW